MLWRKAWLECRIRVILSIFVAAELMVSLALVMPKNLREKTPGIAAAALSDKITGAFIILFGAVVIPVICKIMAGAGVNTQTAWGMMKGFHGSMYFLLSLPVSRAKLLAVRATMGALLTLGVALLTVAAAPAVLSFVGESINPAQLLAALPRMLLVGAFFYCQAVWLTSFLDEFWSGTIGLTVLGLLLGLSGANPRTWGDLFHFLSPAGAELPAWHWILYLAASAAYLVAARWVVERKDY